jgi:small GTP-binding protein
MSGLRFKVVMIGDSGVGKTALVNRMSDGNFSPNHVPTVGSQFVTIELTVEGRELVFELWDTAGQEVYRSLVGFYARDARGAFVVADVTSRRSYEALKGWISFIRAESPSAKLVLFANKIDLAGRVVRSDEFKALADDQQIELFEGSAKSGEHVADAFERMGEMLIVGIDTREQANTVDVAAAKSKKKETCC